MLGFYDQIYYTTPKKKYIDNLPIHHSLSSPILSSLILCYPIPILSNLSHIPFYTPHFLSVYHHYIYYILYKLFAIMLISHCVLFVTGFTSIDSYYLYVVWLKQTKKSI